MTTIIFSRGHETLHLALSVASVRPEKKMNSKRFSHYCSCPTVRDCIAVYPALFFSHEAISVIPSVGQSLELLVLGIGPRGPMSCRIRGQISKRFLFVSPSVYLSLCLPARISIFHPLKGVKPQSSHLRSFISNRPSINPLKARFENRRANYTFLFIRTSLFGQAITVPKF